MLVKNISGIDITFMYESDKEFIAGYNMMDTVNLVAGWTVDIPDATWKKISTQTTTIYGMSEEIIQINDGKASIRGPEGDAKVPTKTLRQWDGTAKEVNLVKHLIKTRQIEIIEGEEIELPPRHIMESFAKRMGEKGVDKLTDEELAEKVKQIKAELEALNSL